MTKIRELLEHTWTWAKNVLWVDSTRKYPYAEKIQRICDYHPDGLTVSNLVRLTHCARDYDRFLDVVAALAIKDDDKCYDHGRFWSMKSRQRAGWVYQGEIKGWKKPRDENGTTNMGLCRMAKDENATKEIEGQATNL